MHRLRNKTKVTSSGCGGRSSLRATRDIVRTKKPFLVWHQQLWESVGKKRGKGHSGHPFSRRKTQGAGGGHPDDKRELLSKDGNGGSGGPGCRSVGDSEPWGNHHSNYCALSLTEFQVLCEKSMLCNHLTSPSPKVVLGPGAWMRERRLREARALARGYP